MDLCEPMIPSNLSYRCRATVADRCSVAKPLKRRHGQGFALQRCLSYVIVAANRCSCFSVADRCTVAIAHNSLFCKAQCCNGDRCRLIVVAIPPFLRGGIATMQRAMNGQESSWRACAIVTVHVRPESQTSTRSMGLAATSAGIQQGVT